MSLLPHSVLKEKGVEKEEIMDLSLAFNMSLDPQSNM